MKSRVTIISFIGAMLLFLSVYGLARFSRTERGASDNSSYALAQQSQAAFDAFVRNQNTDRLRAVGEYKKIIVDEGILASERARAVHNLLGLHNAVLDRNFAQTSIFVEPFFNSFLADGDVDLAVRRLYEFADDLFPTSRSSFRIALWYGRELRRNDLSDALRKEYIAHMQQWIERGRGLLSDSFFFESRTYDAAHLYQLLAANEWNSAQFSSHDFSHVEETFAQALRVLAPEDTVYRRGAGLYIRFYYAALLATVHGEARRGDIEDLVLPLLTASEEFPEYPFLFYEFLRNSLKEVGVGADREYISLLSGFVPEFGELIRQIEADG